ncbi:periplasmic heavy metal sensor [Paracoccus sp. p3-h83]|uniref:periplasmic heavy metal sensor n=1 Tax=Paracoccus sp. p3-h83 TaxID=3342805 RepID=UPI0035B75765
MTQTPPRTRARAPLWMRLALIVSLAVNLLVAGIVVGGLTGRLHHPPPPLGEVNLGAFTPALTDDDRKAIRERAAHEGLSMREVMRTARAEQAALIAALRAEPWDREAIVGLLGQIRSRAAARLDLGSRLVLERLDSMSPGERKALADRMEAAAERHKDRKRR